MSSDKKGTFLGDQNPGFIIRLLPFCNSTKDKNGTVGGCSLSILGIWEIHLLDRTFIYVGSPISAIINSRALFSPFPDLVLITTACNLGPWTARGNELPSCVKPPKNCSKSPGKKLLPYNKGICFAQQYFGKCSQKSVQNLCWEKVA